MNRHLISVAAALILLGGCGGDNEKRTEDLNKSGIAGQLVPVGGSATIDLVSLLDPARTVRRKLGSVVWRELEDGEKVDRAFEAFYTSYPPETRELRRNRIQERIFAVSRQSCEAFKNFLLSKQDANKGFLSGMASLGRSATRIIAGPGIGTALRGAESLFGRNSEVFNLDLFASLTMQVIADGIDARRSVVLAAIVNNRAGKSIAEYTAEAAVKDALYLHELCSIFTGMRMARDLILEQKVRNREF